MARPKKQEAVKAAGYRALAPEAKGERIRVIQQRLGKSIHGPWASPGTCCITDDAPSDWSGPATEHPVFKGEWYQSRVVEAVILDDSEPDHRKRSEMCERFLREHGESFVGRGYGTEPNIAFRALMKEFGIK